MAIAPIQRRLAAVLAADVVGYSRLMGADEVGTRELFNGLMDDIFRPGIATGNGRIVKTMGDGLLVEFASAVDAVRCAVTLQENLAERNAGRPEQQQMAFRVGVNLGDIIIEGDDIHGDGVNIAARLESLADSGGIVVSGIVHEIVRAKIDCAFEDLGPQRVKNIADPVHAYRARPGNGAAAAAISDIDHTPPVPEKPSIAVIPFANTSGGSDQDYFAEGLSDDLITDLSKNPDLFVVARNTSFSFKDTTLEEAEIARRLGVRHLLQGAVRRAGNRVRINVQLVDAQSAGQVWAERYDGELDDIFDLQDDITGQILAALNPRLTAPDEPRPRPRTRSSEAYDLCLKGRMEYYQYMPQHLANAVDYFRQAIALDPDYAEAYSYLSYCLTSTHVFAWPGADETLEPALALAKKSVQLDNGSAVAHGRLGWIQGFLQQVDAAIANFEKAVALDPRNAEALYAYGETMNRFGEPERALPILEKAFSIDAFMPHAWMFAKGHSYILMRRYDEALAHILPVIERAPKFIPARAQLARAYSEMGRLDEARAIVAQIVENAPKYTLASAGRMFPYPKASDRERLRDGLIKAGLPQ